MFRVLLLVIPIFMVSVSHGFINVESLRASGGNGFAGKTKAQVSGRKGNTDKIIARGESTNTYRFGKNELLGLFYYQYGETSKIQDTNRGSGHLRYTRQHWQQVASEFFIQRQFDDFQNLEKRDLLGIGLRTQLIKQEKNFLFLGTGFFHESEKLGNEPDNYDYRGNIYLSYFLKARDHFEFSSIFYYQPKLDDGKDFRFRAQLSLEYKLFEAFSLVNELSVAHDSRPPAGVELTDIIYTFGFTVNY